MEDKKQDVNYLEELSKVADALQKCIVVFGNELSRALDDIKALKKEEDTWEMKIPYKYGDDYWVILDNGDIDSECWDEYETDGKRFNAGNVFPTLKTADLEKKRRNLLTRFNAFRDECNEDWNPNWDNHLEDKYYIGSELEGFGSCSTALIKVFPTFGYFKNREDIKRAIDLFGDEIKALFGDCEGD